MKLTWGELVERAKRNDQNAFYDLYQNSYNAVYRTVKSMVRDDDAALDITQDAFVKGFASLSTLEDPEQFLPWMKRIATNKAKDWFKKKREMTFSQLADEDGNEPDFVDERAESLPEAVMDRNETARLIEEILRTLPDEQRMVIGMFYYQNMSIQEIAQELEINENTVKSRLNYGKKKIRASVEDLEKKGTKLYTLAPIPFLLWLFRNQIFQISAGGAPAATFGSIMSAASAAAGGASAGTAAAGSAASGGAAAAGSATSGATAAGSAAAAAAGKAAGGGLLASLGAKVTAGVLAAALLGGGVGAGMYLANRDDEESKSSVVSEQIPSDTDPSAPSVSDGQDETPSALHAKELLTQFLEEELIPEKGIYNIEQPSFSYYYLGGTCRIDTTYDPATGKFQQETLERMEAYKSGGIEATNELEAAFEAAKENRDLLGLFLGDFYDYDSDGDPELLTAYGKDGEIWLELFDAKDGQIASVAKLSLKTFDFPDSNLQWLGRFINADGEVRLVIIDHGIDSLQEDRYDDTFYLLSVDLKPISRLSFMDIGYYNNYDSYFGEEYFCDVTEFFYDSGTETITQYDPNGGWIKEYDEVIADYGGNREETLCTLFTVGVGLTDFLRTYYKSDTPGSAVDPGTTESPGSTAPTEELLLQFFEEELIPDKGIYDLTQPSYISNVMKDNVYGSWICTNTYDPATGNFQQDYSFLPGLSGFEAYKEIDETLDVSGVYYGDLYDFDSDGDPELLTLYGESGVKVLEVFDVVDGKVISMGRLSFARLADTFSWLTVSFDPADEGGCFVIYDASGSNSHNRCYRFSYDLKLLSVIMVSDTGSYVAHEDFYDGERIRTFYLEADELEDALAKYGYDTDFNSDTLHTFFTSLEGGGIRCEENVPNISMEDYWIKAHR